MQQQTVTLPFAAERLRALIWDCIRGLPDENEYRQMLEATATCVHRPDWVGANATPDQMRRFLRDAPSKRASWEEREDFVRDNLGWWLDHAQKGPCHVALAGLDDELRSRGPQAIVDQFETAKKRLVDDSEGAITIARTLLEATCKEVWRRHRPADQTDLDKLKMKDLLAKAASCITDGATSEEKEVVGHVVDGLDELAWAITKGRKAWGDAHSTNSGFPAHLAEWLVHLSAATALFLLRRSRPAA